MPAFAALAFGTQAVGSMYSGFAANAAAGQEASLQREQGQVAEQEAQVNATNEAFNQTQAVERQRLAFLANGVSLEGSPTAVIAQSKAYGQQQVNAILAQGAARANLAYEEAGITEAKGRAALVSGGLGGISASAKAAALMYKTQNPDHYGGAGGGF